MLYCVEFLKDLKTHARNWSFDLSQVSYIYLVSLLRRIESYAVRRNRGLATRGLIRKMLIVLGSIEFCVLCFFERTYSWGILSAAVWVKSIGRRAFNFWYVSSP